jgi:hypothetical protein
MTLVTLTWPLSPDAQAYIAYHTARPTAKITFRLIYISLYCWRDPWQYSGQTLRISIFRGYQHKDTSYTKQEYASDFWFIRRTNRRLLKCDTVLSGRVCWRFRRLVFREDDEVGESSERQGPNSRHGVSSDYVWHLHFDFILLCGCLKSSDRKHAALYWMAAACITFNSWDSVLC